MTVRPSKTGGGIGSNGYGPYGLPKAQPSRSVSTQPPPEPIPATYSASDDNPQYLSDSQWAILTGNASEDDYHTVFLSQPDPLPILRKRQDNPDLTVDVAADQYIDGVRLASDRDVDLDGIRAEIARHHYNAETREYDPYLWLPDRADGEEMPYTTSGRRDLVERHRRGQHPCLRCRTTGVVFTTTSVTECAACGGSGHEEDKRGGPPPSYDDMEAQAAYDDLWGGGF